MMVDGPRLSQPVEENCRSAGTAEKENASSALRAICRPRRGFTPWAVCGHSHHTQVLQSTDFGNVSRLSYQMLHQTGQRRYLRLPESSIAELDAHTRSVPTPCSTGRALGLTSREARPSSRSQCPHRSPRAGCPGGAAAASSTPSFPCPRCVAPDAGTGRTARLPPGKRDAVRIPVVEIPTALSR